MKSLQIVICIALIGQCELCFSQQSDKADYTWIQGLILQPPGGAKNNLSFQLNFCNEEVSSKLINKNISIDGCNASYSDEEGNLLMYTNGIHLADSSFQIMENGDSISEMSINDIYPYYKSGYPFTNSAIFLPIAKDKYYLLLPLIDTIFVDQPIFTTKYITYSEIEFDKAHPNGRVTKKRQTVWTDTMISLNTTACRHANGRDWWFITQRDQTGKLLKFLIDSSGIHGPWYQEFPIPKLIAYDGGSVFTPDGTKYCHIDPTFGIQVYDFDRCMGELSNFRYIDMPYEAPIGDVVISPNSRFMYVMTGYHVIQFDLNTPDLASLKASADTVGYTDPKYPYTNFAVGALAPDGKIYITTSSLADFLPYINFPDKKGKACKFIFPGLKLPKGNGGGSLPNFPNYRLGPIDGSACDTLGIDNIPKARFRINHDTLMPFSKEFTDLSFREPMSWYWTFGDGEISTEVNPVHVYQKKGEYDVCLTVSNQYGSDTACKTFGAWSVSTEEDLKEGGEIMIYPNPVKDKLNVLIKYGSPRSRLKIMVSDILGKTVLLRDVNRSELPQELDVSALINGIYLLQLFDGFRLVQSERLIITK